MEDFATSESQSTKRLEAVALGPLHGESYTSFSTRYSNNISVHETVQKTNVYESLPGPKDPIIADNGLESLRDENGLSQNCPQKARAYELVPNQDIPILAMLAGNTSESLNDDCNDGLAQNFPERASGYESVSDHEDQIISADNTPAPLRDDSGLAQDGPRSATRREEAVTLGTLDDVDCYASVSTPGAASKYFVLEADTSEDLSDIEEASQSFPNYASPSRLTRASWREGHEAVYVEPKSSRHDEEAVSLSSLNEDSYATIPR